MLLLAVAVVVGLLAVLFLNRDAIERWYRFRSRFAFLGVNAQGHSEYRDRQTDMVFVAIAGGVFRRGGDGTELGAWDNEAPAAMVRLSSFLIAKYEASQDEWWRVMGGNPARFQGVDLPVENVSWHDCMEFCSRVALALPTEAQWERACRAGTLTPFAYGAVLDEEVANFNGTRPYGDSPPSRFRETTVPCTSLSPNPAGLHHMHGNVAEWCRDVYDEDFYSDPASEKPDPVATSGSGHRVLRGGGWYSQATHCRSAHRSYDDPSHRGRNIGFRPVWEWK